MTPRKPLHCVVCDEPCHEIREVNAEGLPTRAGPALPGTRLATLVLLSGARADVTLCPECEIAPDRLLYVWQRCNIAGLERLKMDTDKLRAAREQFRDLPLGVLAVKPNPAIQAQAPRVLS